MRFNKDKPMKSPILLLGISLLTSTACGGGGGSAGAGDSPLQITDALLQALVDGNASAASGLILSPNEFSKLMKCSGKEGREVKKQAMKEVGNDLKDAKNQMSYLSDGPRPKGLIGQITRFEVDDRDFEEAGQQDGPCTLARNIETVEIDFRYVLADSPWGLDKRGERDSMEIARIGKKYYIVEAPEMEAFEEFAKQAKSKPKAFGKERLKACRAEAPSNVKAIKEAQMAFEATEDQFLAIPWNPYSLPGKKAAQWTTSTGFEAISWQPDGKVRGQYQVTTTGWSAGSGLGTRGDFEVTGRIDCDGDGVAATYTATKSLNAKRITKDNVY